MVKDLRNHAVGRATWRTVMMAACMATLPTTGFSDADELDGSATSLNISDLDSAALDAARRYFATPSMQALSALRHDPRANAHQFTKNLPENAMTADQRDTFIAITLDEFSDMKLEHDETTIRVLAHVYTAEELDAIIAFEQTEVGRKVADKRPVYSVLVKDATASLRRDALGRIMERFTGIRQEPRP